MVGSINTLFQRHLQLCPRENRRSESGGHSPSPGAAPGRRAPRSLGRPRRPLPASHLGEQERGVTVTPREGVRVPSHVSFPEEPQGQGGRGDGEPTPAHPRASILGVPVPGTAGHLIWRATAYGVERQACAATFLPPGSDTSMGRGSPASRPRSLFSWAAQSSSKTRERSASQGGAAGTAA